MTSGTRAALGRALYHRSTSCAVSECDGCGASPLSPAHLGPRVLDLGDGEPEVTLCLGCAGDPAAVREVVDGARRRAAHQAVPASCCAEAE